MDSIDKMLTQLKQAWKRCPRMRLGQLIGNSLLAKSRLVDTELFYMSNQELIQLVQEYANHAKEYENLYDELFELPDDFAKDLESLEDYQDGLQNG